MTRVMRGSVISTKQRDYVDAARALGARRPLHHPQAHPGQQHRAGDRAGDDRAGRLHQRRGHADLPRASATSDRRSRGGCSSTRARPSRWPASGTCSSTRARSSSSPCSPSSCWATCCVTPSTPEAAEDSAMTDTKTDVSAGPAKSPLSGVAFDPSAPLLEVEDLQVEFHTRDGVAQAVNGVSFTVARGRDPGHPRRVRLRQVRHRAGDHGHPRHAAGADRRRPGALPRRRPAGQWTRTTRRHVRANKIAMIFQDALSLAEPRVHRRLAARRAVPQAPGRQPQGGQGQGRSRCSSWSASRRAGRGSTTSRTSSPAACGSA